MRPMGAGKKGDDMNNEKSVESQKPASNYQLYIIGMLAVSILAMAFTQLQLGQANRMLQAVSVTLPQQPSAGAAQQPIASQLGQAAGASQAGAGTDLKLLEQKVLAKGVPDVYGSKLGISYDNVEQAMKVLAAFDDGNPMADAGLNARYVKIGTAISCEYCCGADSIIFPNGQAACGCAHSYAMRGLAKYLLANNPEMSDEKILDELAKWKSLFFPKQSMEKAVQFNLAGKDINPTDLMSNKFRGFTAGAAAAPTGSAPSGGLGSYASQVGGC